MVGPSQCINETPIPDASEPLIFFIILTTIYGIVHYNSTKISETADLPETEKSSLIWNVIYILLLIVGNYFINLNITTNICGQTQWGNTLMITLIPWILIFGVINIVLIILPGWLSPFSNTIGYLIVKIMGIKDLLNKILKPQADVVANASGAAKEVSPPLQIITSNLQQIYSDRSLLVNQITPNNFKRFWDEMLNGELLKANPARADKNELYNFVILKNIIAQMCWFILTGTLVTSVGYNYLVNSNCKRSVAQLSATHKAYEKYQAKLYNDAGSKATYTLSGT